ncbi:HAD-IIA family hydrolase [Rhodococcus triatomae]|uniref:HAD-superfamily subfamily IIA hydrolase, TIGR01458 n=1 Tax=Rhodococcus triatomae TaxID=300028 RepID=A0A1G8NAE9_9NOCA|nr:HAD-IIA family hydrolase [Rhodococcus triatomae]QNG19948.1 HAD-IIA family hydrolase [Rhodococcus triatomae]QNG24137.1 HAD-IIA family hydrolase [Rhodococcus triatomae]SDI77066.1 HAD-superfamily subfamily IIA hydrolase, TIGR01458 [Rhodococcus triatomae]
MAVQGVLFDIDGVLVTSWRPIEGAAAAVRALGERGVARAFLTNTTSRTCAQIAHGLREAGIDADEREIVTATRLTAEYLRSTYPGARVWLLNSGDVAADLAGIELDEHRPEVIVLGGAGPEFDHETLGRVVELMLDGVPAVAMHRGAVWAADEGLRADVGLYLPGVEQVTGTSIVALGKPSAAAFLTAADIVDTDPDATCMVGDDLAADVLPAQRVGLTGILVRTGKFRQSVVDLSPESPDHVIDSVAQLPGLIDTLG